jgi:hypothetical protein
VKSFIFATDFSLCINRYGILIGKSSRSLTAEGNDRIACEELLKQWNTSSVRYSLALNQSTSLLPDWKIGLTKVFIKEKQVFRFE